MRNLLKKIVAAVCVLTMLTGVNPGSVAGVETVQAAGSIRVTSDNVLPLGKTFENSGVLTFSYANSGVEIHFKGTQISADFTVGQDNNSPQKIAVFVDKNIQPQDAKIIKLTGDGEYTLAEDLPYGEHTVTVRKTGRGYYGFLAANTVGIRSINLGNDGELLSKNSKKKLSIEVFGDSITNGDALMLNEDGTNEAYSWQGYVGEVARYFDADLKSCGISGNGLLRSVLSDENGTYFNLFTPQNNWPVIDESVGEQGQVAYDHNANPADVVIINLGTNDNAAFSAGQISANDFYTEYLRFINEIHQDCPDAIVVGALGAMGADGLFDAIRSAVHDANAQAQTTYAYFTELTNCGNIWGGKAYDNSHPSAIAHRIYGQQLIDVIEPALQKKGKFVREEKPNTVKANVISARGSSYDDTSRRAQYAVDGDNNTRWASTYNDCNEWLEMELDAVYEVRKIDLLWEAAFAQRYQIETSLDGVSWHVDTVCNGAKGGAESRTLNGSKAKYVRVTCLERGTYFAYSLYEATVYGRKTKQTTHMTKNVVGEMLMPKGASPAGASVLIDNSGMSGLEAPNHLHASFDSNDGNSNAMISSNMYSSEGKDAIVIDLGRKESLGEMYFWNYNDIAHLDYGMKTVQIDYSKDGVNYTHQGVYVLGQSSLWDDNVHGGNVACSVDNGHSVDFGGVAGRYVRITPVDNYGGGRYGLSEVRIFRHKTEPKEGDCLTVDGFAPYQLDNETYTNIFNNSGMSEVEGTVQSNETHSNDANDMAVLNGAGETSMLILNLDGNYPINQLKIWNYNNPLNLNIGMKEIDVYYTVDAPCDIITHSNEEINAGAKDYIDWNKGSWKKLGTYTINKGTGSNNNYSQLTIDFGNVRAQHIKIVPKSNYGGDANQYGLSEIKVYVNKGWATEYSREWTGLLSSSGEFKYQGNSVADNKGSSLLNNNNGRGWIGGDGMHSTRLNGEQLVGTADANSKTLFTFQDSFEGNFGNYDGFGLQHGYATQGNSGFSIGMRNMAYMMLTGNTPDVRNVQYYMQLEGGISESDGYGGNIYPGRYWLGDSTVIDNAVYTVANRFEGLSILGADFYKSPLTNNGWPSMKSIPEKVYSDIDSSRNIPYHECVYEEGNYIYSYGKKDNKLVVSRTTKENYPSLTGFTYWNGSSWVDDANQAVAISQFMPGNEFNVTKISTGTFAGKYMLVHTSFSITGATCYAVADSPMGPFVENSDNEIYWATEKYKLHMRYYSDSSVIYTQWNYNAKSHPAISSDGELLISYHFGIHDNQANRVPEWGYFTAVGKEYEHPTMIKMFDVGEAQPIIPDDYEEETTVETTKAQETTTKQDNVTTEQNETSASQGNTTSEVIEITTNHSESGHNPGFDPSKLSYIEVACTGSEDTMDPMLYALKDGATLEGTVPWYGDGGNTFMLQYADVNAEGARATVTVNGEQPGDGMITEKAQGLVKVNPNTLPDNTYNIITVTLDSGKEATFVIKKGDPPYIPDSPTTADEKKTTKGDDVTTTKTDETTKEEITTSQSGETTKEDITTPQSGETTKEDITTPQSDETTKDVIETTTAAEETQKPTEAALSEAQALEKQILSLKNDKDPKEATFGNFVQQLRRIQRTPTRSHGRNKKVLQSM